MFGQRGFTPQQMVALSGAHTLGTTRCSSFKNRLTNFDSTHDMDPSMDTQFARTLSKTCSVGDSAEQPFDTTRNIFDKNYFNALQRKAGVLFSDQTLFAKCPNQRNSERVCNEPGHVLLRFPAGHGENGSHGCQRGFKRRSQKYLSGHQLIVSTIYMFSLHA
ncbi:UNVERIFIED_CONTAM: Peroxidase 47 [Sesamum radiatum]|uniref:peroxidase n=1 Tax=Sesamum radiatum TaxID=300843 RepID=A0AAW2JVG3_SESRA